jgi:preprotein translocase SecE subunit
MGLDDPTIDESGLTDTTAAPDPLKNASAEVDQARAAEAGALPPDMDLGADELFSDDDFERAPDAAEEPPSPRGRRGTLERAYAEEPEEPAVQRHAREHHEGPRVIAFLRACWDELQRVQWPDRRHVFQATAVVLGFVLVAGGWLGLMDAIWQPLINAIL